MQPKSWTFLVILMDFTKTSKNEKKLCSQILFFARVFENLW